MKPFGIGLKESLAGVLATVLFLAACAADMSAPIATLVSTEDSTRTAPTNSSVEHTESVPVMAVSLDTTVVKLAPFPAASFTPTVNLAPTFTPTVLSAIISTSVQTAATLNPTSTPPPPITSPSPTVVAVLTATVRTNGSLRSGPGANYIDIDQLKSGERLVVVGRMATGDWLQVRVSATSEMGWMSVALLDVWGNASALPIVSN